MKTIKKLSIATPYIAVLIGFYIFQNGWLAILLYHIGIFAFIISRKQNKPFREIFAGFNRTAVILSVSFTTAIFPILICLWSYMEQANQPLLSVLQRFNIAGASWPLFMIYFSTVQPVLEELFWRGYLTDNTSMKHKPSSLCYKGLSWIDIFFAGYHLLVIGLFVKFSWLPLAFILLVITSLLWRNIAARFQGLATTTLSHIAADISIITAIHILK